LWLRVDPDMLLLRRVELTADEYVWQFALRYERDIVLIRVQLFCGSLEFPDSF
jgi:hypothetical protein